jgi:hypothetical protein
MMSNPATDLEVLDALVRSFRKSVKDKGRGVVGYRAPEHDLAVLRLCPALRTAVSRAQSSAARMRNIRVTLQRIQMLAGEHGKEEGTFALEVGVLAALAEGETS